VMQTTYQHLATAENTESHDWTTSIKADGWHAYSLGAFRPGVLGWGWNPSASRLRIAT
jgi:hypothetical protein